MKKRLFAIVLAMCLMLSLLPATAMAVEFEDTTGHWGENAVNRWAATGVVNGDGKNFFPDNEMTRAEMAKVLANLLGLTAKGENKFADLDEGAWYADAILKCAAAGIMLGDGVNVNPNGKLTREEATVLLGRALGIQPKTGEAKFEDGSKVSDWAAGYVNAMNDKGIVQGVGDNNFAPAANINRASVVTILNNAISTYVNTPGEKVEATGEGITLVAAPDVTVTGKVEDMVVSAGAQGSEVTVQNTTVAGTLTVAAAETTVTLKSNTTTAAVVVTETAEQSKVVVEKAAQVGTLTTAAPKAEVSVAGKVETVTTTNTAAETKVEVKKDAVVGEVAVAGEKTDLTVSGKVENVTVSDSASNTKVEAAEGSTITKVDNAATGTTVTGSGKVENVTTSGDNTKVETGGTKVEVAEDTKGTTVGDKEVSGGSTTTAPTKPSTGGSTGGGYVPPACSHEWGEYVVTKAATCTEAGEKTRTCSKCNVTEKETIDALGHNYENGFCTRCYDPERTEENTASATMDNAVNYVINYVLNMKQVNIEDLTVLASVSEYAKSAGRDEVNDRKIVIYLNEEKSAATFQQMKTHLKDCVAVGDITPLIDNGLCNVKSVTIINSDGKLVTLDKVPDLCTRLKLAKNMTDVENLYNKYVKEAADAVKIEGIDRNQNLGGLVTVTTAKAIRVNVVGVDDVTYNYTISFDWAQAN